MLDFKNFYHFYYYISKIDSDFEIFSEESIKIQNKINDFKNGKNQDYFLSILKEKLIQEKVNHSNMIFVCIPCSTEEKYEIRYKDFAENVCKSTGLVNGYGYINELNSIDDKNSNYFCKKDVIVFTDLICSGKTANNFIEKLNKANASIIYCIALAVQYEKFINGFNPMHPWSKHGIREDYDEQTLITDSIGNNFENNNRTNNDFNLLERVSTNIINDDFNLLNLENNNIITTILDDSLNQSTEQSHIGLEITIGTFNKQKIQWIVLQDSGKYILIITKYAIKRMPYNDELCYITWDKCSLRSWLNNEFYKEAFNNDERKKIQKMRIPSEIIKDQEFDPSGETEDYISIMSIREYEHLFGKVLHWKCKTYPPEKIPVQCWLRNNGLNERHAAFIGRSGAVHEGGSFVNSPRNGVRPIMWISK